MSGEVLLKQVSANQPNSLEKHPESDEEFENF